MSFPLFKYFSRPSVFAFQRRGDLAHSRRGFTLIELLIVIAILGILSAAVVVVLNPAELLKQARDSQRIADLDSLNTALRVAEVWGGISFGTSTIIYTSLPDDASSTCGSYSLPTPPSGYAYRCATTASYKKADGTGWVPVNFAPIETIAIPSLPIDPVNTTTTGSYYTYIPGGSWHLAVSTESEKYGIGGGGDKSSTDGGSYPELYETGTNLALLPVVRGDASLVGYWSFGEGSGTSARDSSGRNHEGTLNNGATWGVGKLGGGLVLDGSDDFISALDSADWTFGGTFTAASWVKWTAFGTWYVAAIIAQDEGGGATDKWIFSYDSSAQQIIFHINNPTGGCNVEMRSNGSLALSTGTWYHLAVTRSGNTFTFYKNGSAVGSTTNTCAISDASTTLTIGKGEGSSGFLNGILDDTRLYNRTLSGDEILNLYQGGL